MSGCLNVAVFHKRCLEANYSVSFLDGTYLPLRHGTVSKECIHIALGITPEGQKVILGYEITPNEKTMLVSPPCYTDFKVNASINGLANVLTHLKAYLINTP